MINFKTLSKKWIVTTDKHGRVDPQNYKKHFQMAIINLEQNMIEERMPELKRSA